MVGKKLLCVGPINVDSFITVGEVHFCEYSGDSFVCIKNIDGVKHHFGAGRFIEYPVTDNSIANYVADIICEELE